MALDVDCFETMHNVISIFLVGKPLRWEMPTCDQTMIFFLISRKKKIKLPVECTCMLYCTCWYTSVRVM